MGRVLVTGGAGYIGSHTCKALHEAGYSPLVYDERWRDNILDGDYLHKLMLALSPVAIIHLAATAHTGATRREYESNNIMGSRNVIAATKAAGIPVVFASSCAVYGDRRTPIRETDRAAPINDYGMSKYVTECDLSDSGVRHASLRYFNVAGADPAGELGESHQPETHLIPRLLSAMQSGAYLTINGAARQTRDGTAVRDYVHVSDVAQANVLAMQYLLDGGPSVALNIGSGLGLGHSVLEVIKCGAEVILAPSPRLAYSAPRYGDPPQLVADTQKATEVLGWSALYSLSDMIIHQWGWMHR